jgi:hypothetical protein
LLFFWLLFLLVALALDFFSKILSSSKILPFPFPGWDLLELADSRETLLSAEFSPTKPHDNNCMAGSTEKRRKILSICKLVNACPPNKLPQIPPTAIDNQVMDCRSPANDALFNGTGKLSHSKKT